MNPKIASRVRRRLLVAVASALGFPVVSQAFGGPNSGVKMPGSLAQAPGQAVEGVAAESVEGHVHAAQAWEGERLVLSGRLTDPNGEAIARAVVGLTGLTNAGITTLSDADGRFMLVTTAPANDHLDLQVTAPSGKALQRAVPLLGQTYASDPKFSFAVIGSHAGRDVALDAHQQVWWSSLSLSIAA